jgi:poly(hydroxyalkanoate) granule-associated protein
MARKTSSRRSPADSGSSDTAQAVRDSAQKIWLAGLGAFERARSEGPKMFEVLVEQGKGLRERARDVADEAMKKVSEASGDAQGRWDLFEDRVAKTLGRLGVRGNRDVDELAREVRELNETVRDLMRGTGARSSKARAPRSKAAGSAQRAKAAGSARAKTKARAPAAKRAAKGKAKASRAPRSRQP